LRRCWLGRHRSAFCHPGAAYTVTTIGAVVLPPVADLVPAHAAAVLDALAPWPTGGQLPNFGASADPERLARCYDEVPCTGWPNGMTRPACCASVRSPDIRCSPEKASEHPIWMHRD
jgi:hypothetical protein